MTPPSLEPSPLSQLSPPPTSPSPDEMVSYSYSYPHKSSFGRLDPPVPIAEAWREEDLSHVALYVHLPFCEMRCGFCNLFTQSQPEEGIVAEYLRALSRQMRRVREAVGPAVIRQFAIGGGTPTYLAADQLERLLGKVEAVFGLTVRGVPSSVETSPATATEDRLRLLAQFGVERISLGVQSLDEGDLRQIGRPQGSAGAREVHRALEAIRRAGFPVLNVDLIYGDPQQSLASWRTSLAEVLRYAPEEIFLYPLYVRPETGLARVGRATTRSAAEHRRDLYRAAQGELLERGYQQTSLRCFRLPRPVRATEYACQGDGMVGLGCGARSYTRGLHYATRFAVSQAGVRAILGGWIRQSDEEFALATHGIALSEAEQRRRFVILGLLQTEGLSRAGFQARFGLPLDGLFPELEDLRGRGWVADDATGERLVLTEPGMENSDVAGPLLYSPPVRERLREFVEP